MKPSAQDRIVIRRPRAAPVSTRRAGAWKIAYADYMTAMMAFFLIMWILSLVPKEELGSIAEYFRTPLITAITGGKRTDYSSQSIKEGSPSPIPGGAAGPTTNRNLPAAPTSLPADPAARRDARRLEDLKSQLEAMIDVNPVLSEFRPQLLLDMTPDGLRVQIVDKQNRPMFATGSAWVQPYMRDILRELGPVFNQIPNPITISGHTDAVQYSTGERLYSNWELSADRANAARQELVAGGMREDKIKLVVGLSSTVSLIKDDPNAAVNRRISLLVLNKAAEQQIDDHNAVRDSAIQLGSVDEAEHAGDSLRSHLPNTGLISPADSSFVSPPSLPQAETSGQESKTNSTN